MATRSLSHHATIARHRQAVMMWARRAAIKVVNARLRDQGVRLTLVLPKDINALANDYLAQHGEQLIAEAEHAIATSPLLKRWRLPCADISSDAQTHTQPKSTTSTLQISGAK